VRCATGEGTGDPHSGGSIRITASAPFISRQRRDVDDSEASALLLSIAPLNQDVLMALWKETTGPQKEANATAPESAAKSDLGFANDLGSAPRPAAPRESTQRESAHKESIIGGDVTIVGRIDGVGNVRLAGKFEGDVNIQGDLTVEIGAKLTGSVRANAVVIAGEVEGNIEGAARVELLATGVLNGDLKAGTLIVAAGSKMRGRSEFGWNDETPTKAQLTLGSRQVS
jgi:cytoskeletal protein CcmA (bactofilin family)